MNRTWLKYTTYVFIILVAGLVLMAGFHALASASVRQQYPAPGELIDVGGHRLHLLCMGEGSPTVVMEAGLSGWSADWSLVQPEVAKATRACAYDRAGYGWSEPGPGPRDSRQVATELHTLLAEAGVEGELILAGHSLGGVFVQYYAKTYPEQVRGVVLIDSVHPEQSARMSPEMRDQYEGGLKRLTWLSRMLGPTGLLRLAGQPVSQVTGKLPEEARAAARTVGFLSRGYRAMDDEMAAFRQSQAEAAEGGPLRGIPLAVISSQRVEDFPPGFKELGVKDTWDALQADLSREAVIPQVIAEDSGHYIHLDQPELAAQTILEMVNRARVNQ